MVLSLFAEVVLLSVSLDDLLHGKSEMRNDVRL
jgi:hypothetical protein